MPGTGPVGRNFTSEFTIVRGSFTGPNALGATGNGTLVVGGLRHVYGIVLSAGTTGYILSTTSGAVPSTSPSIGYQVLVPSGSGLVLSGLASGSSAVSGATFYYQAIGE
jgi:hypothetical protein